ncbi:MAG: nuclear transport factor 2 family protein [Ekhidna sp.]
MKYFLILAGLVSASHMYAQSSTVLEILEDQIEAFNSKNIDKLVANVSDDFKWYYIGSDTLLLEVDGKPQFKKSMEAYFNQIKNVKSEIAEYAIDGNRISFKEIVKYETISGKMNSASAMAIYEMKDDLIYRVWYFF